MHIEPGIVDAAKITLSHGTAAGAAGYAGLLALRTIREQGAASLALRTAAATAAVFTFFQILPHAPVGVSEVHLILGSTLFLLFGAGPAALGLGLGLLAQGLFLEPLDLPQYGMNLTTLLVPLFATQALARRIIAPGTAYVDLRYGQALALSTAYQAGIVSWVAFWVLYGQGLSVHSLAGIGSFGAAYLLVVLVEPLADLAVLAAAKSLRGPAGSAWFTRRLHHAA